ncbi:MAG: HigA family addiction module antitoxin [Bryobacteraceae bacterium]
MAKRIQVRPVHPGEILREDVLPEVHMTVTDVARSLGISRQMMHSILAGRKPISAVMCLKIAKLFGSTPEFWMRLQADYDLAIATHDEGVMRIVAGIAPVREMST